MSDYGQHPTMRTNGEVVTFKVPPKGVKVGALFVVTSVNARTVTLYPLGGGTTRYWRADPRAVERVDIEARLRA